MLFIDDKDASAIPKLPSNKSVSETKYIKEAQEYVNKNFPNNYGTVNNFQFPILYCAHQKLIHSIKKKSYTAKQKKEHIQHWKTKNQIN